MALAPFLTEEILRELREAVGGQVVLTDPEKLAPFAKDGTVGLSHAPEAVVEATTAGQVQRLLHLACRHRFPVTPRGLGTGLAGGAIPICGGVVLSLARMNRILSIEKDNLIAVVEPGVLNLDLKNAARAEGLFFPPDPASLDTCSVGGNAATNAGGPSCVKYGTTRDYVLGLEVVLASGELLSTGVQTRKGVVGYDLTHLFVGSEGTLGVITKLVLKLLPHPPAVTTMVGLFPEIGQAMQAIERILAAGHLPSALEFLDRRCLDLVGDLLPFPGADRAGVFLLVEADGVPERIQRDLEAMGGLCAEEGATEVFFAPDAARCQRMWEVRKAVSLRIEERHSLDCHEDVVVPLGRIARLVSLLPAFEMAYGMTVYAFGHAGDGNIHLNITAEDPAARPRVEEGIAALLQEVLALGGTISGEHGIGCMKKRYLSLELSAESMGVQERIKKLFDPLGILNPGKLFG